MGFEIVDQCILTLMLTSFDICLAQISPQILSNSTHECIRWSDGRQYLCIVKTDEIKIVVDREVLRYCTYYDFFRISLYYKVHNVSVVS